MDIATQLIALASATILYLGVIGIALFVLKYSLKKPYKRPPIIVATCVFLLIGLIADAIQLMSGGFNLSSSDNSISLLFLTIVSPILSVLWVYGLWHMKKWAVIGMLIVALLGNAIPLLNGEYSFFFLAAFLPVALIMPVYSKMK